MNNLAQEMSPLDDGFRARLDRAYARWQETVAAALTQGQRLFEGATTHALELAEHEAFSTGVLSLTYRPAGR